MEDYRRFKIRHEKVILYLGSVVKPTYVLFVVVLSKI